MYEPEALQEKHSQVLVKLFRSTKNADKKSKLIIQYLEKNPGLVLLRFVKDRTLLHMAVIKRLPVLVQYLLKQFPELLTLNDSKNKSALNRAVSLNMSEIVELFRQAIFPSLVHHQADDTDIEELSKEFGVLHLFESGSHNKQPVSDDDQITKDFASATSIIKTVNDELEDLGQQLESQLLYAGFESCDSTNVPVQEDVIWELCAANEIKDNPNIERKRRFDKKITSETLQGIMSQRSPAVIINNIKKFWSNFDSNQKLTAIFVLKELLFWDISHALVAKEVDIKSLLRPIFSKIKKAFPQHGVNMVFLLKNLISTKEKLASNELYQSYLMLSNLAQSSIIVQNKKSFETLLLETLSMKDKKQKDNIELIANEFRAIMLGFYHTVRIDEYYSPVWSHEHSPHIVRQIDVFNHLSDYIRTFILQAQTPKDCAQRIALFIRVAAELCHTSKAIGPDLGSVNIITTAISSGSLARLKPVFMLLSDKDKAKFENLKRLNMPEFGFTMLRKVAGASRLPLFNSSLIQSDVRLCYENKNAKNRHEALGSVLQKILQLKRAYSLLPFRFGTNLLYLLGEGRYISIWNHLYCLSGRFVPVNLDAVTFDDLMEIIDYMISNQFCPMVLYAQTEYQPESIFEPILNKMKESLYGDEFQGDDYKLHILKARKVAFDLINLLNHTYGINLSHELINLYLPEPSPIALRMKERNSIEYENPPVYIVKRSPPLSKRHTIDAEPSPVRRRNRLSES